MRLVIGLTLLALGMAHAAPTTLSGPPGMMRGGQAAGPGEDETRQAVDRGLTAFTHAGRKLTLGLLRQAVGESIAFGAPAYNRGEVDACARFYVKTGESVVAAFPEKVSAGAARGVTALKTALARCATQTSAERRAWIMRFAFDKIELYWQLEALHVKGLADIAAQSFAAERFTEAADGFRECTEGFEELAADDVARLDAATRSASVMLAHALIADHDYPAAARALEAGLAQTPDIVKHPFDLHRVFRQQRYDALLAEVEAAAAKPGAPADTVFVLGYLYHSARKADLALAQFKKVLTLDAGHRGAQLFLK